MRSVWACAACGLAQRLIDRHNPVVLGREKRTSASRRGRAGIAIVLVGLSLVVVSPVRADDNADGRKHAKRASHLAALGKCKQAIAEYDKALAVMHDPALLFNRAECHRKLGDSDAALEDYNQFLTDLPQAPNRAEVEARIAELRKAPGSVAAPVPKTALAGAGPPADDKSRPQGRLGTGGKPAVAPAPATAGGGPRGGEVASLAAPAESPAESKGRPVPLLEPSSGPSGAALPVSNREMAPSSRSAGTADDSLIRRPWFWVAVAVVTVGAGVGTYVLLSQHGTSIPTTPLGNYKF